MKVNIYVNWNEQKVYNEEDFLEEMQNEVNDNFNEWSSDWLNEEYTAYDLFYLTDSEKKEIEEIILCTSLLLFLWSQLSYYKSFQTLFFG